MTDIYGTPEYYEIAFSFRDFTTEVDFFEACVARFYPQELRLLVADHGAFEIVGHFDGFDLDAPVAEAEPGDVTRPVTVLRRTRDAE